MTNHPSLDHAGLSVLPHDECLRRLRQAQIGRIAFIEQGEPVILPVNHGVDGDSVVFRSAPGAKLFAANSELPVAFEVDGFDADGRTGWSVVVRGTATIVEDQSDIARLALLGVEPWADLAERKNWVRIRGYSVSGREVVHQQR
ncbi:MAG: pyridoxamine 5'-phosphate oxidase family protein [Nakamurella sp.]